MPSCPSMQGSVTMVTSSEKATPSGVTISRRSVSAISASAFPHVLDPAFHVELTFGNVVVLAVEDVLESTHGVGDGYLSAFASREDLRDAEGLAQEALNTTRSIDRRLVLGGQFVHTEDRDDVLEILEALQHALHSACDLVVLLANDVGREGA